MNVSTAKKYIAHFWTVFLFLLLPVLWKTIKAQSDSASKTEFKPSWLGMPVAFYTPETRWAGGATGLFNFKLSKDTITRTSQVALYGVYTQEDQIILRLPIGIFTPDNRFWIRNDFEIYHYPYKFWGVGNDTPDDAEEAFTPEYFRNELVIMKRFFKHLFLGMQFEYMNYKMDKFEKGGLIDRKAVYGADGGTTFGFGLALRLDSRDNIFAPSYAAVALGAAFIERHITLDRAMWGSDQAASVEIHGMYRLVKDIRDIEHAMGDGQKKVYDSELGSIRKLRRVKS